MRNKPFREYGYGLQAPEQCCLAWESTIVLVQRDLEFRRLGLVYSPAAFSGGMSV